MFSKEERNKLFKLLSLYKESQSVKTITASVCMEDEDFTYFEPNEFLEYVRKQGYLSNSQIENIKLIFEDYVDKEDAFTSYLKVMNEDLAIFDLWYINYVADTCPVTFDICYENWKGQMFGISKKSIESQLSEISENFEDIEDELYSAYRYELNHSQINLVRENFEALKEITTNSMEKEIVSNLESFFED